jgi:DNA-binding MarR family transcriptional regulator
LKEKILDKMCDVSRMVERLRLKKLINRQLNIEDRRAVDIVISDKGLALLKEIDQYLPNFEQVATPLTVKELEELNVLLDKIRG